MSGPPMHRYAQTKLANSVFSYALHEKLQAKEEYKNIRAIAAHPGVADTALFDHMDVGFFMKKIMLPIFKVFMIQSSEDGAMGLVKGMMDSNVESGTLYGPSKFKGVAVPNPPKSHETDTQSKEMLWKMSEKAVGVKFDI
jgi:short-subunit dehydrogenase